MSTNYSLLFYLKKPKNYVGGSKPIYMRITVAGEPSRWNAKANRAKGTKEDVKTLNAYLDTIEHKIAELHLQMVKSGEDITAESIKLKYLGKDIKRKTLLDVFLEHNNQMEALLGNGFKPNTLKGYKTSLSHIELYLKTEHKSSDIDVRKMDHGFVRVCLPSEHSKKAQSRLLLRSPVFILGKGAERIHQQAHPAVHS